MNNEKKNYIEIIQLLRFIAALLVIFYHCNIIPNVGAFGVEIFCVISGYTIMLSTKKENSNNSFLIKRLIRIVPLYWILTVATYGIVYIAPQMSIMSEAKIEYLIKSLLFIPFVNSMGFDTPLLAVGWTLNYEIMFYLIFMLAMTINHKHRGKICSLLILLIVLIGRIMNFTWEPLKYYSSPFLLEFIFGIVAYEVSEQIYRKSNQQFILKVILTVFAIAIFCYLCTVAEINNRQTRWYEYGIPVFIMVLSVILVFRDTKIPKILITLGNMTFSIYLIEYFTTALYKLLCINFTYTMKLLAFFVLVLITILLSCISYELIEIKLTNKLKQKLIKS